MADKIPYPKEDSQCFSFPFSWRTGKPVYYDDIIDIHCERDHAFIKGYKATQDGRYIKYHEFGTYEDEWDLQDLMDVRIKYIPEKCVKCFENNRNNLSKPCCEFEHGEYVFRCKETEWMCNIDES